MCTPLLALSTTSNIAERIDFVLQAAKLDRFDVNALQDEV